MPIDFFKLSCQETTNVQLFGLCDDPPPSKSPAYIEYDSINKPNWIAEVVNNKAINVTFTAIDNCIIIKRPNGEEESKCDGMLTFNDSIVFVELKDRIGKGWLGKARDQLITTISIFSSNHNVNAYKNKRAHIANAQRPFFQSNYQQIIDEIKTANGFITEVESVIEIR